MAPCLLVPLRERFPGLREPHEREPDPRLRTWDIGAAAAPWLWTLYNSKQPGILEVGCIADSLKRALPFLSQSS